MPAGLYVLALHGVFEGRLMVGCYGNSLFLGGWASKRNSYHFSSPLIKVWKDLSIFSHL